MRRRWWMADSRAASRTLSWMPFSAFRNHRRRRRTNMPRHFKIGLIVLGVGFAVALGFFVDVVGRVQSMMKNDKETEENPFKPPTPPLYAKGDPPMDVKIFFPSAGDPLLIAQDEKIFRSAE